MPFSRGSSWPRDGNQVSCIAGGFFTIWAIREAPWNRRPHERTHRRRPRERQLTLFLNSSMTSVLFCLVVKSYLTFATPCTITHQAPLSMGFPRWEQWSGLPFPSPGDLRDPGIELTSPALAGGFFTTKPPAKVLLDLPEEIAWFINSKIPRSFNPPSKQLLWSAKQYFEGMGRIKPVYIFQTVCYWMKKKHIIYFPQERKL